MRATGEVCDDMIGTMGALLALATPGEEKTVVARELGCLGNETRFGVCVCVCVCVKETRLGGCRRGGGKRRDGKLQHRYFLQGICEGGNRESRVSRGAKVGRRRAGRPRPKAPRADCRSRFWPQSWTSRCPQHGKGGEWEGKGKDRPKKHGQGPATKSLPILPPPPPPPPIFIVLPISAFITTYLHCHHPKPVLLLLQCYSASQLRPLHSRPEHQLPRYSDRLLCPSIQRTAA